MEACSGNEEQSIVWLVVRYITCDPSSLPVLSLLLNPLIMNLLSILPLIQILTAGGTKRRN